MGDLGSPSEKAGSPSQEYPLAMHLDIPKKNWACSQEHHPEVRGDSPVAVAVAAVADAAVSSTADAAAVATMDEVIVCHLHGPSTRDSGPLAVWAPNPNLPPGTHRVLTDNQRPYTGSYQAQAPLPREKPKVPLVPFANPDLSHKCGQLSLFTVRAT